MATMAATDSSSAGAGAEKTATERLPMPSRNPLPLSASQEAQVRDIFYDRVRQQCAAEIKGMASAYQPVHITLVLPSPSPSVPPPPHLDRTC